MPIIYNHVCSIAVEDSDPMFEGVPEVEVDILII